MTRSKERNSVTLLEWKNMPVQISYVGWNDKDAFVMTNCDLGRGVRPKQSFGLRRAIWDAAFGYVNGFKVHQIFYYVLTRSLSSRVENYILDRNERIGKWSPEFVSLDLSMRDHCIETGNSY